MNMSKPYDQWWDKMQDMSLNTIRQHWYLCTSVIKMNDCAGRSENKIWNYIFILKCRDTNFSFGVWASLIYFFDWHCYLHEIKWNSHEAILSPDINEIKVFGWFLFFIWSESDYNADVLGMEDRLIEQNL